MLICLSYLFYNYTVVPDPHISTECTVSRDEIIDDTILTGIVKSKYDL